MSIMYRPVQSEDMAGAHRQGAWTEADAATRTAILDAASALFAERGYVATTVDDIADAAHVAAGTVYTSVGDKAQLLEAVVHRFATPLPQRRRPEPVPEAPPPAAEPPTAEPTTADPVAAEPTVRLSVDQLVARIDHRAEIRAAVHANRLAMEAFADFYDLIHRNGPMGASVAGGAATAEDRMRRSARQLVDRLAELKLLRVDAGEAMDLLAYFLGNLSWRRLVHDFGWSYDDAEAWLTDRIAEALLTVEGA
jgi:AcrR family transcriptional regulator